MVGDTTTTMMWIDGVAPRDVLHAYVASVAALLVFGIPASMQQQRYSPIVKRADVRIHADWVRIAVVGFILSVAVTCNVVVNVEFPELAARFPFIGVSVWVALLIAAPLRAPDWKVLPGMLRGTMFLLCLVFSASLMPVDKLPAASWPTALGLGFISAVFDNIPLTKLALEQRGYDWGILAYAVGFGGSMLWFGSSAGVAISTVFPQARSVGLWLRPGWHVAAAYVLGFFVMLTFWHWHPDPPHKPGLNREPAAIHQHE